jgi:hypothetical protein
MEELMLVGIAVLAQKLQRVGPQMLLVRVQDLVIFVVTIMFQSGVVIKTHLSHLHPHHLRLLPVLMGFVGLVKLVILVLKTAELV